MNSFYFLSLNLVYNKIILLFDFLAKSCSVKFPSSPYLYFNAHFKICYMTHELVLVLQILFLGVLVQHRISLIPHFATLFHSIFDYIH